ncbi:MAG: efflux RND transporter periplasmic adaptor subunit [Paracoccaceae bacterium]|nr:efflux RND transporter periplasmic adaptor subunit [Paracoccaceae bacterium]
MIAPRAAALALAASMVLTPAAHAQEIVGVSEFARLVDLHAKVSAAVSDVVVAEGAAVLEGDTLIRLDDRLQRARFQVAETAANALGPIARAEAQLRVAKDRHARLKRAAARGGAPKWEVAEAEGAVAIAEATLRAAMEEVESNRARRDLEAVALLDFTITAPFDGIILETNAEIGALPSSEDPLAVVADPSEMRVSVFVPVERVTGLSPGDRFPARIGMPFNREIEVTLESIDPRVEPSSRTLRVVFHYENDVASPAGLEIAILLPDGS